MIINQFIKCMLLFDLFEYPNIASLFVNLICLPVLKFIIILFYFNPCFFYLITFITKIQSVFLVTVRAYISLFNFYFK